LLSKGATVVINGRSADRVESAVTALRKGLAIGQEGRVIGVTADVSTPEGAQRLFDASTETKKTCRILILNAGIFSTKDFFETSDEDWMKYWNVNMMSCVRLARLFLKPMLESDISTRLIVMASEAGVKPLPHMLAYSVSKTANISLARGLAELTKGTKCTVNSVLPGPTRTEGVMEYFRGLAKSEGKSPEQVEIEYFEVHEPTSLIKRLIDPAEVAATVSFLASDAGGAINGASVRCEGGTIRSI